MTEVKRTRQRRSAEEARRQILDVAERRLAEAGPDGVRLQEIAAELGVSHPAILHHFGSREGLLRAVVDRAVRALEVELVGAFAGASDERPDGAALLNRVFQTLSERGHARLLAWLILSGQTALDVPAARANWKIIADAVHRARIESAREGAEPSYEDTLFTIVLASLAMFAEAVVGPVTFDMAGLGADREAEARFRQWLARLLTAHLSA